MRVIVMGCGYVGLVTGACLAEFGHAVVCVDHDPARIVDLARNRIPIFEPGLEALVEQNAAAGRLSFTGHLPRIDDAIDAVFIAVGTPRSAVGGRAELEHVFTAARQIAHHAQERVVVVIKSTVPVGTGDAVEDIMRAMRPDLEVAVVSNPEFLREGDAVADCSAPDRIVIGANGEAEQNLVRALYAKLEANGSTVLCTGRRTAELIKYASNAFLATKISFINEIADLCELSGADVIDVAAGMGLDPRIGRSFLRAGVGFGGSCFPKDSDALLATAHDHGSALRIVQAAVDVNRERLGAMAQRVVDAAGGDVRGVVIAVLGLAFKPDTDDVRDAPAISLVDRLLAEGAIVRVFDPEAMGQARARIPKAQFAIDAYDCVRGAQCLVLATEWSAFGRLDFQALAHQAEGRVFVDLRNALDRRQLEAAGFRVLGIGRGDACEAGRSPAATMPSPKLVHDQEITRERGSRAASVTSLDV